MKPIPDLAKENKDKQRRIWQAQQVEEKDDQGPYPTVLEITSHNLKDGMLRQDSGQAKISFAKLMGTCCSVWELF